MPDYHLWSVLVSTYQRGKVQCDTGEYLLAHSIFHFKLLFTIQTPQQETDTAQVRRTCKTKFVE